MAVNGHLKFGSWTISVFLHWNRPLATIVDRFGRVIHQNACFDARGALLVQKDTNFSFHPQNPPKPPIVGTSNAFPMENKNLNNFSTAERRTVKLHKFNPLHKHNNSAVSENRISKSKMADGAILNF